MLLEIAAVATILGVVIPAVVFIYHRWKDWQRKLKPVSLPWFVYDEDPPAQPTPRSWPPPGYTHASRWGPNGFG